MRITGLATGLDMDQIIKDSMKPHRVRIDQTKQKKEIIEIKQQLYRDVIKDSREFYNEHFDVTKSDSLMLSKNWSTTTFSSSNENAVTVKGLGGSSPENFEVSVTQVATKATAVIDNDKLKEMDRLNLTFGEKSIEISNITDEEKNNPSKLVDRINKELEKEKIDVKVKYSSFSNGLVFESGKTGKSNDFVINGSNNEGTVTHESKTEAQDAIVTIKNTQTGVVKEHTGESNTFTYDGIEFTVHDSTKKLNSDGIEIENPVKIIGKTDSTGVKDKLVTFINDYNKIIESLNEQTMTKPNKDYMPLTEEQKKEMSETEIKLWEERVKKGQLYRDSDLTRVANQMKSVMSSVMGSLEKIGIKPIGDYQGTKNGTFTIDEEMLDKALSENPQDVMNLFIGETKNSNGTITKGIMTQLKDVTYDNFVTISSPLIKKAGIENSSTAGNNELTRSIEKYNKKLADMEKDFKVKEQALYSKYARLEVAMNKYNSQQAMLMQ